MIVSLLYKRHQPSGDEYSDPPLPYDVLVGGYLHRENAEKALTPDGRIEDVEILDA